MNSDLNIIGKYRAGKKMSKKRFAELMGLSSSAISRIECKGADITVGRLRKISIILDLPIYKIIEDLTGIKGAGAESDLREENRKLQERVAEQQEMIRRLQELLKVQC